MSLHTVIFKPFLVCLLLLAAMPLRAGGGPLGVRALPEAPLYFESNAGQFAPQVRFLARAPGYQLYLSGKAVVWRLHERWPDSPRPGHPGVIRLRLDAAAGLRAEQRLSHVSHYYIGSDPRRWRQAVPAYGRVVYRGVYPGIDLVFHGQGRRLEYDFRLAPGADPAAIALDFEGARPSLDAGGALVLESGGMRLVHHRPRAYQEVDGRRRPVAAAYRIANGRVSFRLGNYDPAWPLVIDPVVDYAAYLGGGGKDEILDMAVDANGNVYVTGRTDSPDFPGAATLSGSEDAFVSKFDPQGQLLFSTYLGGDDIVVGGDVGRAIAVDGAGRIYVAGDANYKFPVTPSAFDATPNASASKVFVAVLDAKGGLSYASYYGGGGRDEAHAIAVDGQGAVYVAGRTTSADLPLKNAYQSTYGQAQDAFLFKLDPSVAGAAGLQYATYFGGTGGDAALALVLAGTDRVYVAGETNSGGLGTPGAYTPTLSQPGNALDAFVTLFDTARAGSASLQAATYLGGSDKDFTDRAAGLALDGSALYVAGTTETATFPVSPDALRRSFSGGSEAFLAVFAPDLTGLVYATFLGGSGDETGEAVAVDGAGTVYVTGGTTSGSGDFPGTGSWLDAFPYGGGRDAFLVAVDAARMLSYGLYLGGENDELGLALASSGPGVIHVAGWTESPGLAGLAGAPAGRNGFLLRLHQAGSSGDGSGTGSGSGGGSITITDGGGNGASSPAGGGSGGGGGAGLWLAILLLGHGAARPVLRRG